MANSRKSRRTVAAEHLVIAFGIIQIRNSGKFTDTVFRTGPASPVDLTS